MNPANQSVSSTQLSLSEIIRTRWLNFRRKRFWLLFVILLYTILGFLVAPVIIKNSVLDLLQKDLGRTATIDKVKVNPYVLSLTVDSFKLEDKDQVPLAAFSGLYVNFQLSSLFNRAWTFDEVRLVDPYFFVERFSETESRLSRILSDFDKARPAEDNNDEQVDANKGMPRLLIHDLNLVEGRVDLKDNLPAEAVETKLAPINISIQGLNTLPDLHGRQSVTIQLPEGASLTWAGSLTLAPLDSQGELKLENLHVDPAIAYLKEQFPLESMSATVSAQFQYHVHMDLGGSPKIDVSNINLEVEELVFSGLTPSTEFISIPKIALSEGSFHYPEQTLQFSKFAIYQPRLTAWLDENSILSLSELIPTETESSNTPAPAGTDLPWQFGIDEFRLEHGVLNLSDKSIQPVANLDVNEFHVNLDDFSNKPGASIPIKLAGAFAQGGEFKLDGTFMLTPEVSVSARLGTTDLPLALGQPYIQQLAHIEMKDGVLNSDIQLGLSDAEGFTASGSVQIPELLIDDTIDQQKLLSWKLLDIDKFDFNLKNNSLNFSQLTLDQSFSKLLINEDKTTNLSALVIVQDKTQSEAASSPIDIIIGGILINDSEMDFSDLSLPLPFSTHIANLDGSISTIDTGSDEPANIKLEGQVDEFGLARINGGINLIDPIRHTDVNVEFRNLSMSNLSPYTVQFAGREIDQGKLDLDLTYDIKEGLLNGSNNVVLSDLELGEKFDHPGASSLPLGLAVGLLKDADGIIKIDLPVKGDINDPEFQIGGVVGKAIAGLITRIVSAPFRLLGNLIGIDSEELGQFEFLAGRADLTPPELEKVLQLEEALQQRPELVIEINGVSDNSIDRAALKRMSLIEIATELLGEDFGAQDDVNMMLDDKIRAVVEQMFIERFPDVQLADIKTRHTSPPASDPQAAAILDELSYATDLWKQMLAVDPVSDQDLNDLAEARAEAIKQAFLANGQFGEERIKIGPSKSVESDDDEWITLELAVASG